MKTANELAEVEYDGGGEMSEQEEIERLHHAQKIKQDLLLGPDSCLVDFMVDEGHVKTLMTQYITRPLRSHDALDKFMGIARQHADDLAMNQTEELSWAEIQHKAQTEDNDLPPTAYGQEKKDGS